MRPIIKILIPCVLVLFSLAGCTKNPSSTEEGVIDNPYLGQSLPGSVPELFAPDILSPDDWGITFSPNGGECFFARKISDVR